MKYMQKYFEEIIALYSKYDLDISVVVNDVVNTLTMR